MHKFRDPKIAVPVIVVALALAVYIALTSGRKDNNLPPKHYYYDLNTKETFVVHSDTLPPIEAPSKKPFNGRPAGVQIHFYTCGACNEKERFIGFLSMYTEEEKAKAEKKEASMRSIRLVDDEDNDWHRYDSPEGQAKYQSVMQKCPAGTRIQACTPR